MQGGERVRWTAGNIEIHGNQTVQITNNIRATPERPAGYGTAAAGNNDFGCWHRLIGGQECGLHVLGDRTGNMNAIGMSGRGDKLDAKTGKIKKRGVQDIGIRFAGIAACGGNLTQLQGAAKKLFKMGLRIVGKLRQVAVGQQMFFFGNPKFKILGEPDKIPFGHGLALPAKNTAAKINQSVIGINRILRTQVGTFLHKRYRAILVNLRQPPISLIKGNRRFRIF